MEVEYDLAVRRLQRVLQGKDVKPEINLTMHHFLHLLVACGFHACVKFLSVAQISVSNSNSKKHMLQYVASAKGKVAQMAKMQIVTTQASLYLSTLLGCDVNKAETENLFCEAERRDCGIDPYFPGQTFFRLESLPCGRSAIVRYLPVWDPSGNRFKTSSLGIFDGVHVSCWDKMENIIGGILSLRLPDPRADSSDVQLLATRDNIGPLAMAAVKETMFSPRRAGESASGHYHRICSAIKALPPIKALVQTGQKKLPKAGNTVFPLSSAEVQIQDWNQRKPQSIQQGLSAATAILQQGILPPPAEISQHTGPASSKNPTPGASSKNPTPEDLFNLPVGDIEMDMEPRTKKRRWGPETQHGLEPSWPSEPNAVTPTNFNPIRLL